ncbi:MAG TPA: MFS transporter [Bacteroidales bacterium]|nr:MFS transporter [Bacteroidales bacterium]HQG36753.1 MFS transporter [Bacteroidales bacterium]HQG53237.1 MFS transporter [Bacteroidales bacterium]HQJ21339.1 MFS transporter [Bacteroidales bacterium]
MNFSSKIKTIFRSLKYRNYRLFFFGQSISLIGTWMQRIALPWLVYQLTDSVFLLGVVGFAGQIPAFLLSPVAGVITDRFNRYNVLLVTQIASFFQALILSILAMTGVIKVWHILLLSIIHGCINAFDSPSRHAFVIEMVEKKEDLGNAIALNSLMVNGARLIGPSVAGIILAVTDASICFLINAISYLFVVFSLFMMHLEKKQTIIKRTNIRKEMKEGLAYTFGFKPIRSLILLLALVNLMGASYQVLMPVYAKDILHGGSDFFGFLMSSAGLGALISALYLASRESVLKLGNIIPVSAALFGVSLIILSVVKTFYLSVIIMVFVGAGLMCHSAGTNTILQTITNDDMRGRVMSYYTMAIMGTLPFGNLLTAALAKLLGTPAAIFIGGLSSLVGALLFLKKLPELRKIVRPVYIKMGIIPEVASGLQAASEPANETTDLTYPQSGKI